MYLNTLFPIGGSVWKSWRDVALRSVLSSFKSSLYFQSVLSFLSLCLSQSPSVCLSLSLSRSSSLSVSLFVCHFLSLPMLVDKMWAVSDCFSVMPAFLPASDFSATMALDFNPQKLRTLIESFLCLGNYILFQQ